MNALGQHMLQGSRISLEALRLNRSHQIDPVGSEENSPLAVLQLDQLPRVKLRSGSNFNPHLITVVESNYCLPRYT